MRGSRRAGCAAVVILLLAALGVAAWLLRGRLLERWVGQREYATVSTEAAASGEAKLERLRSAGEAVRLTEAEAASLLHYRIAQQYPELLQNPSLRLAGDTLHIGARFPTERLPELRELERVRAFLPDTTRIDLAGRLLTMGTGRAALDLDEVAVAGVPIPRRYYPDVLDRLGRRDEPGLPPEAFAFPLPDGVGAARVDDGTLVLSP